ncbi:hypothetical protein [Fusicatenibacter sp.]
MKKQKLNFSVFCLSAITALGIFTACSANSSSDAQSSSSISNSVSETSTLSETETITAKYMPAPGDYRNASDGESTTITISPYDDTHFKFKISSAFLQPSEGEYSYTHETFCGEQIASFENPNDTVAVYKNELYDISFDCSDYGRIHLSGLDEATTLGSSFGNSEILHIN